MRGVVASTAVTWEDAPRGADPTAKNAQIASLTGLRGFASLMVVLIHVSFFSEYPWLGIPDYGPVSLFVLSGFLLYRPWARWTLRTGRRPSVRTFAYRRLARIFPAYLVVLIAVTAIHPPARPEGLGQWLRAASLTWIYQAGDFRTSMQHTWSLGTELSWYVALPVFGLLIAALARRMTTHRAARVIVGLLACSVPISIAWRWWVDAEDLGRYFTYSYWLPGFLFCFAGGALVAHASEARHAGLASLPRLRQAAADPWALPVLALAFALVGTSSLGGPPGIDVPITLSQHLVRAACATLVAVILLVGAVMGPPTSPLNRILGLRWMTAVGRWSYGIYLWHLPLIAVLEPAVDFPSGALGLVTRLALILAIAVPLSAATYDWVERPAIAWSRRLFQPRAASAATASTTTQPASPAPAAQRRDPAGE